MTPFEEELKKALARREPDADFTARLLARIALEHAPARPSRWFASQWFGATRLWQLSAAAAVLAAVLVVAGGSLYQRREREMRGEAAKRQLLVAMRIAGDKLQEAQNRVRQVESSEENQ